jgi:hypothetical protein
MGRCSSERGWGRHVPVHPLPFSMAGWAPVCRGSEGVWCVGTRAGTACIACPCAVVNCLAGWPAVDAGGMG